jgi:enoyl-CoA hydratase/carnithine racemase
LRYETANRKAYITLNRPERLNAIDRFMPGEIDAAVELANDDPEVHVIVLRGEGRSFCSGYDLKDFAEGGIGTQGLVGSDQGFPGHEAEHRSIHQPLPVAEAHHLPSARSRGGRRQRYRPVLRSGGDG